MHNGDDLNDTDYPLMLRSNQTTSRPFRRELSDFKFPVDTSDLRVHVLIGYLEEAVKRPLRYYTSSNDDDSDPDDSSEYEDNSEEDDMITKIQKYSSIGCIFTEKDGTQEPYEVRVRFSFSRLPDEGLPDDDEDDEERFNEITSLETKADNDFAEPENVQLEDIPKENESVKKSNFKCLNCFTTTAGEDDQKEMPKSPKKVSTFRKVFNWYQRFKKWIDF